MNDVVVGNVGLLSTVIASRKEQRSAGEASNAVAVYATEELWTFAEVECVNVGKVIEERRQY